MDRIVRRLAAALPGISLALALAGGAQAAGTGAPAVDSNDPNLFEHITVYVLPGEMGFLGPDGKHHDTIAPSDFVLHVGVPVVFTVVNYDDGGHSITAPKLGVNIMIKPGTDIGKNGPVKPTITTYSFTPARAGEFHWNCDVMCDGPSHWAMSAGFDGPGRDGYMAGWFKVL